MDGEAFSCGEPGHMSFTYLDMAAVDMTSFSEPGTVRKRNGYELQQSERVNHRGGRAQGAVRVRENQAQARPRPRGPTHPKLMKRSQGPREA